MAHGQQTDASGGVSPSPIVAALCSLFVPGVGQLVAGHQLRALGWIVGVVAYYLIAFVLTLFVVGAVLLLFAPVVHLGAAADAYVVTSR